jgi:hypothetical protein
MSEFGHGSGYESFKPVPILDDTIRYPMYGPSFNARWFINERMKEKYFLFKQYPELGQCTILSFIEKNKDLHDLKAKFLEEQKIHIVQITQCLNRDDSPFKTLPIEIQLLILKKYTHPELFRDINYMEYRDTSLIKPDILPAKKEL